MRAHYDDRRNYNAWNDKDTSVHTFSLWYKCHEEELNQKKLALNLTLSACDKKTVRVLVYESDDITELSLRLINFLDCHSLLKLHREHHAIFHRSLCFFIENKMCEIGVPIQMSGPSLLASSVPIPTV